MAHPALSAGRTAVITGAASGIGLAAARRLAGMGMNLCLADRSAVALDEAAALIGGGRVRTQATDVARLEDLQRLHAVATEAFGEVHLLMNNAGVGVNPGKPWENRDGWSELIDINLWGVIHGVQAFVPGMIAQARPRLIVNTGSKQGITLPPGNTAYNVSKAGVKTFTEALAHELRNSTGPRHRAPADPRLHLHRHDAARARKAARRMDGGAGGRLHDRGHRPRRLLYSLPGQRDPREVDEKRMAWAAGDLIHNRPALSRWHPDFGDAFAAFMKG